MMRLALIAAVACLTIAAPARADALADRLRAEAVKIGPEDFAWTRTTRVEQREGDSVEARTMVERFDPAQPPARRWTLVSIDGHAPSTDEAAKRVKAYGKAIVPNYGRAARYLAGKLERLPDPGPGRALFRFSALPAGSLMIGDIDVSGDATGEATVETGGAAPYISQVHFVSVKPVRMMLVVKMDRMEATIRYRPGPDGRPVPSENITQMTGSMMGRAGSQKSISTFADWRAVRR